MPKAKDSFTEPDYKEAENPQAHKYTHDPDTKKCIHCGYGLSMHRDNGTGMVRGNKFTAYDSELKPIPVETEDQVLGKGAVGDGDGPANARTDGHLAEIKKTWNSKIYAHYMRIYNAEGKAAADKYLQQFTTRKVGDAEPSIGKNIAGYYFKLNGETYGGYPTRAEALREYKAETSKKAKDSGLDPIPVTDTEWNDPKPRGGYKLTTSAALKTPSAVAEAYGKKDPEGFKKTFGKDEELKPIKMAWNTSSKGATYSDVNRPFGGLELRIIDCVRANWLLSTYNAAKPFVVFGAGKRSEGAFATLAEAKSFVERVAAKEIPRLQSKYAKDSELKPIPVNDFTPRGGLKCAKCGTSVGQVNRTVSGRALCGRCKAISAAAKDTQYRDGEAVEVFTQHQWIPGKCRGDSGQGNGKYFVETTPGTHIYAPAQMRKAGGHTKDVLEPIREAERKLAAAKEAGASPANDCCYFVMS